MMTFPTCRAPKEGGQTTRKWTNPMTRGGVLASPMSKFGMPFVSPLLEDSRRDDVIYIPASAKLATLYPPLTAFPKNLPEIFVPGDAVKTYGLGNKAPQTVRREITDFVNWSTTAIQLDRSDRYSAAVQRTTTEKHETCILAYLGFLVNVKAEILLADVRLSAYSDPFMFAAFLAFLKSRDVGRGHILKHVSLARKVNNYLISGILCSVYYTCQTHCMIIILHTCYILCRRPLHIILITYIHTGSDTMDDVAFHGANMETWLGRLEQQLSATMPKEPKSFVPSLKDLYFWVDDLAEGADVMTSADLKRFGCLTYESAWQTQAAIIAALTVGRFQPPIRLSIARTLVHPSHLTDSDLAEEEEDDHESPHRRGRCSSFCLDGDCRDSRCLGNHLEILGDIDEDSGEDRRTIRFIAPHHKTDRRGFASIVIDLPRGIFTKLLLIHIDHGHKLLTQSTGDRMPYLFSTRSGKPFSTVNFTHYWKSLMKTAAGIPYFPPSLARTSFVDKYTDEFGEEPALWEGAATIMGNTVKMWNEQYNPLKRGREAQAAVDRHSGFADRIMLHV